LKKIEKTITNNDLPIYQYRLSKYAVEKIFGKTEAEKGVRIVSNILIKDNFTPFKHEVQEFRKLLVSETNPQGLLEYQVVVPSTQKIIEKNFD